MVTQAIIYSGFKETLMLYISVLFCWCKKCSHKVTKVTNARCFCFITLKKSITLKNYLKNTIQSTTLFEKKKKQYYHLVTMIYMITHMYILCIHVSKYGFYLVFTKYLLPFLFQTFFLRLNLITSLTTNVVRLPLLEHDIYYRISEL